MQSLYLEDIGAFLRYADLPGDGPPIVWLHGVVCSSTAELLPVATQPPLRARRSLLVDFLGYGYSDRPAKFDYTVEDHARTVLSLLDTMGIDQCHVVGHSLGGVVGAVAATQRPDVIMSLVMAEANLDPGPGGISGPITEQTEDEFVDRGLPQLIERHEVSALEEPDGISARHLGMFRMLSGVGVHRTATSLVAGTEPPVRELLKSLTIPRTFVNGANSDQAVSPQEDLIKVGVRWETIPESGHAMGLQNPSGFADVVAGSLG